MLKLLQGRTWGSIERKAHKLRLMRPGPARISVTLFRAGDIGFSGGMIIADGSVMEKLVSSGKRRAELDGGSDRPQRCYSTPQVQVSMEDNESLSGLGEMWGVHMNFCQKSSVGNDVWRVYVHGKKAYDLLKLVLPYLYGPKRKKALYLLKKYKSRTSIPVSEPSRFKAFGGQN